MTWAPAAFWAFAISTPAKHRQAIELISMAAQRGNSDPRINGRR